MTVTAGGALTLISSDHSFSSSERRIVTFILDHRDEIPGITLSELARRSKTSEATVSRFCKHLGFSSYRSFLVSITRDLNSHSHADITDEVSLDNVGQSLTNILATKISEMTATVRAIDTETLQRIVRALDRAGLILIAAVGNTVPVAMDAAFKLNQLGLRCITSETPEKNAAMALTLGGDDVLLVISSSGKSRRLLRTVRAAHAVRAGVVAITANPASPLARTADLRLVAVNHEQLLTTGDFAFSKISLITLIEIVYHFLLVSRTDAREYINRHEEFMRPDKDV